MAKTIQEQIAEMEARCSQLEELQKLFEKAVKNEFGIEAKKIHKILENGNDISSDFCKKITAHFGLKTKEDYIKPLSFMQDIFSLFFFQIMAAYL